jgi:hypothetical protein
VFATGVPLSVPVHKRDEERKCEQNSQESGTVQVTFCGAK